MTPKPPAVHDTISALREALGPGFGFAGPSDKLLTTVAEQTRAFAAARH